MLPLTKNHNGFIPNTYVTGMTVLYLILTLFLIGCGEQNPEEVLSDKEKVVLLIDRTLAQTDSILPAQQLNDEFFKKHFIPRELKKEFIRTCWLLRKHKSTVVEDYQNQRVVLHFLLQKHLVLDLDSVRDYATFAFSATAQNPLYVAYALVMEQMPDVSQIGNPAYVRQLAKSFGIGKLEIYEGIWYYLQKSDYDILHEVAQMIRQNLDNDSAKLPDFYFQNIIIPFLTYTSMSLVLHPSIEQQIVNGFNTVFRSSGTNNALLDFVTAFRGYLLGGSINVRYINALNNVLKKYEFRLFVNDKTCIGYKILDYRIPVMKRGIGEVKLLDKVSVSLSLGLLGMSTLKERDVILLMDNFLDYLESIEYTLQKKEPFSSFTKQPIYSHWQNLQINLPCDSADRIYAALVFKEFGRMSREEMFNKLIRQIAVHEIKHKWDEQVETRSWYNVDSETSAHITEIVYGGVPFYSLLLFINRYQNFYCTISVEEVRDKLRPLIVKCWQLAKNAAQGEIDAEKLITEMQNIYTAYERLEGEGKLPDNDLFRKEIIDPCFTNLPNVSVASIDKR